MTDMRFDWDRQQRTGVAEAMLAEGKTDAQIRDLITVALARDFPLLITRLAPERTVPLVAEFAGRFDYDAQSRTAIAGTPLKTSPLTDALIVTGGTSDMTVAAEAQRTLGFHGYGVDILADCGVAGLWRLTDHAERLQAATTIIAIAGMEGALFPVVAGLTGGVVIAVPTSNGYGVALDGKAALSTALATCSPGVVTVNIDNGFGAAAALLKMRQTRR